MPPRFSSIATPSWFTAFRRRGGRLSTLRSLRTLEGLRAVHASQSGSISLVSLFGLLLLVMLLGMVMNSGQQIDEKIKLQNAVDAATYSSGVVLSRSMNTLAFTNHLLSDVFALTAYMREARDQSTNLFPEEILNNWEQMAPLLNDAEFPKFAALGPAISAKVPREREVVRTYTEWVAAASENFLPVLEAILEQRAIPEFQRALVQATPRMAQTALNEVAQRHANAWPNPVELRGVLWRAAAVPVGGSLEAERSTLPVVDPVLEENAAGQQGYRVAARRQRDDLAYRYLNDWNNETMLVFDHHAKMSQFGNLWRIFTCGQLRRLLEVEYPDDNLPHMLRSFGSQAASLNNLLEQDFQFVGTLYRPPARNKLPGIFTNPQPSDDVVYAQISLFTPRQRLIWWHNDAGAPTGNSVAQGGVPGHTINLPLAPDNSGAALQNPEDAGWYVTRQDWVRRWHNRDQRYYYRRAIDLHGESWSLRNQNWAVQLVPATATRLSEILSAQPPVPGLENARPPQLDALQPADMDWLSNH